MQEEILVTKAMLPSMEEYIEEIKGIWDNHWLTNMGPKHNLLEEQLTDRANRGQGVRPRWYRSGHKS